MYDLIFKRDRQNLVIAQKNGEVILSLHRTRVVTNNLMLEVLQIFEIVSNQIDAILSKVKIQEIEI